MKEPNFMKVDVNVQVTIGPPPFSPTILVPIRSVHSILTGMQPLWAQDLLKKPDIDGTLANGARRPTDNKLQQMAL